MNKVDQLGLQLQKFAGNLNLIAIQLGKTVQHVAVLFAVVQVLYDKEIITKEEVSAKLQLPEDA